MENSHTTQITELLKTATWPHLIASAEKANSLLAELNAVISDLRLEVRELELKADLHFNQIMKDEGTVELKKSEYKISEPYREFRKKAGLLSDIRSIRKNLQRHADLLFEQEKYSQKNYGSYKRVIA